MTGASLPPLPELLTLARMLDDEAEHRRPLLERAVSLLHDGHASGAHEREALAERLERWRYQMLHKCGAGISQQQQEFVDLLDAAFRAVLQWPPHPPRNPRRVVGADKDAEPAGRAPRASAEKRFEVALDPEISLPTVVGWAKEATLQNFGVIRKASLAGADPRRRMLLYAPLYLSSYCINHCLYCHFRYPHALQREHLDRDAALTQAAYLQERGFRHLLLVAGDYPRLTSIEYFVDIIGALVERGMQVAVEIAAQSTLDYGRLIRAGACGVTLYQETYQEDLFARYHPRGPKHWFDWRLEGAERAAEAGAARVGLGILVGLGPPEADLRALVKHGRYLGERFPALSLAFSLPRLHEAPDGFDPPYPVDDDTLLRMYAALRLAFPTAELVLSTREPPELRNCLAEICITQMSAESCTSPGGYGAPASEAHDREQFPVADHRTAAEVSAWLRETGYDVWWRA